MSSPVIIGLDEVGRGPLAGPVVAAAVHLPITLIPHTKKGWQTETGERLFDSKQLTELQREASYKWIKDNCSYGVGIVDAQTIDAIGIVPATEKAMNNALAQLEQSITPTYLLVDGRDKFWFNYPHSSIVEGDAKEACIAAASILAKVTRDRMMREADATFPHYGFASHKGYGARTHIDAIKEHGPCVLHRRSFLRNILTPDVDVQQQSTASYQ